MRREEDGQNEKFRRLNAFASRQLVYDVLRVSCARWGGAFTCHCRFAYGTMLLEAHGKANSEVLKVKKGRHERKKKKMGLVFLEDPKERGRRERAPCQTRDGVNPRGGELRSSGWADVGDRCSSFLARPMARSCLLASGAITVR